MIPRRVVRLPGRTDVGSAHRTGRGAALGAGVGEVFQGHEVALHAGVEVVGRDI